MLTLEVRCERLDIGLFDIERGASGQSRSGNFNASKKRLRGGDGVARISVFRAPEKRGAGGGRASTGGDLRRGGQVRKLDKPVDGALESLHNLVSLLLMRQTQEGGAGGWLKGQRDGPDCDAIFKN